MIGSLGECVTLSRYNILDDTDESIRVRIVLDDASEFLMNFSTAETQDSPSRSLQIYILMSITVCVPFAMRSDSIALDRDLHKPTYAT
jgi:hypothetical protein